MISSRISSILPLGRRVILLSPNRLSTIRLSSPVVCYRNPNYGQMREYKNFGHKPQDEPFLTKIFLMFLVTAFTATFIDWRWCRILFFYYTGQLKVSEEKEGASPSEKKPSLEQ